MGVVYRVRQASSRRILALKLLLLRGRDVTFQDLARFRVEAEAMACLNHPNIVKIRDVGVFAGYPYMALDYAEKGSLKYVIGNQPQTPRWSAELVRTLSLAMQHAHSRGMLHRDLKPANVLVMGDGTPKISDFGLVKFAVPISRVSAACCTFSASALDVELSRFADEFRSQYRSPAVRHELSEEEIVRTAWQQCATRTGLLDDSTKAGAVQAFLSEARRRDVPGEEYTPPNLDGLTHAGALVGSPQYMAPEQASGQLDLIGPHTDVYALGGILYELITGRPPFQLQSQGVFEFLTRVLSEPVIPPRHVVANVPPAIEATCLRCLDKVVKRRYPSASALAQDLAAFLDTELGCEFPTPTGGDEPDTTKGGESSAMHASPGKGSSQSPSTTRSWWPFGKRKS